MNNMKERTPLLDYTSDLFKDVNLSNVMLIASQHILETIRQNFILFIEKGMNPKNIHLIGKCYSTSDEVMKRFRKMGINVSPLSNAFDSTKSFDEQFNEYTTKFLEKINKSLDLKSFDKVIILEDGGNLIPKANSIFKDKTNFIGIEQTSSGYEKIKNLKLDFPVINVARSEAKLKVESPVIAETFAEKLDKMLKEVNCKPKSALIIGAGAIGGAIYDLLKNKYKIMKYDIHNLVSDFGKMELESIIGDFDLIIGCTGKQVLTLKEYSYLRRGVILASASSADREFSAIEIRKLSSLGKKCHDHLITKDLILLNNGFPVTFDGEEISSQPEDIQITLALLVSAVCLAASRSYPKGLIDLDIPIQKKLIDNFNSLRHR